METPRVIFIDDEECMRTALEISLDHEFGPNRAFGMEFFAHPDEALESIRENPFNVFLVIMDHHYRYGEENRNVVLGSDYIKPIKRVNPHIEVVMMSADTNDETLRSWLKNGADKFLYKDLGERNNKLQIFITEALTKFRAKFGDGLCLGQSRLTQVPEVLKKIGVISVNRYMRAVAELVLQSATSDLSVMILGETGTGKELVARAIHNHSNRKDKPFRTIDCTQFKKSELIASELFGSERGAFTGAETKPGLLELSHGGTVFLDEVHHLGPEAQAMLLRFIQERKVRRVGGNTEKFVDVRLVFAAKPVLKALVESEDFLVDLNFRMKEIKIDLPALKDRLEDIEVLSEFFLNKHRNSNPVSVAKHIHPDTFAVLRKYSWPGNIRELENLIKRLSVLVPSPMILPEHIERFGEFETVDGSDANAVKFETLSELQGRHEKEARALILRVYADSDQNLAETARRLGIARTTLRSQCQALGIWLSMDTTAAKNQYGNSDDAKRAVSNHISTTLSRLEV